MAPVLNLPIASSLLVFLRHAELTHRHKDRNAHGSGFLPFHPKPTGNKMSILNEYMTQRSSNWSKLREKKVTEMSNNRSASTGMSSVIELLPLSVAIMFEHKKTLVM